MTKCNPELDKCKNCGWSKINHSAGACFCPSVSKEEAEVTHWWEDNQYAKTFFVPVRVLENYEEIAKELEEIIKEGKEFHTNKDECTLEYCDKFALSQIERLRLLVEEIKKGGV